MADYNLGLDTKVENKTIDTDISLPSQKPQNIKNEDKLKSESMSSEELNDPNKISVTIADASTPLIILFGSPSCGKTMTLVRLTRYLRSINGYTIEPITSFRPTHDKNYEEMCSGFNSMINSDDAAASTSRINFMLVKILYQGKSVCQILEGPGEYYFDPESPKSDFPRYVHAIINSNNRKIWAIMVEPDKTNKRMGVQARRDYVDKITKLKTRISPRDKILFIFNKIDETPFILFPGKVKFGEVLKETGDLYPNIFTPFKNMNPISRLWKPFNFDLVPFQTGNYTMATDGTLMYQEGHDAYPRNLWNTINKLIRG